MRLVKNINVILRSIHGSFFLIDISDNYSGDRCSLYETNEIGKFLWECLDEKKSVEDLVEALQRAIIDEIPYDVLYNDVTEYIVDLKNKGFVMEMDENG